MLARIINKLFKMISAVLFLAFLAIALVYMAFVHPPQTIKAQARPYHPTMTVFAPVNTTRLDSLRKVTTYFGAKVAREERNKDNVIRQLQIENAIVRAEADSLFCEVVNGEVAEKE